MTAPRGKTATLERYLELKTGIDRLEAEMRSLKPKVEKILAEEPDNRIALADATLCLTPMERETFDLKAAREKIDGRTLAPFMKTTKYSQIRVTFKRAEAA